MKQKSFFQYGGLTALVILNLIAAPSVLAQVDEKVDTREKRDVILYRGDLVSLKVYSLTRIAISTPGIVDIVNADVDEILLVGRTLGQTQIFIWDEFGKRSVLARVMEEDLDIVRERIEQLLGAAGIKGIKMAHSAYEGKIIATGKVNKVQKDEFDKVVKAFESYLINMVNTQGDLIQIDAQVTELNTTLEKVLGVDWSKGFPISESVIPANQSGLAGMFRIANVERTELISGTVNALLSTSQARTLSRPSVVVSDGQEANILVGGEVPIPTRTLSDLGETTSYEYKNYGVELSVTPEIRDDDKIDVTINVSIRDIGASISGQVSFNTTEAQTKVLLDDGQTIIIAGLIKQRKSISETKVPFLHRIPVLGLMFRNREYSESPDQELVISLTPHIRRQKNKLKTIQEIEEEEELRKKAEEQWTKKNDEEALDMKWLEGLEKTAGEIDIAGQIKEKEAVKDVEIDEDEAIDALIAKAESSFLETAALNLDEGISSVITGYAGKVQRQIAGKISFPYQAQEKGWNGVVTLSMKIYSDGTLGDVRVKESSGHNIFDNDAVNTAEIVAPFDPFPAELEMDELTVSIPVEYSQKALMIK